MDSKPWINQSKVGHVSPTIGLEIHARLITKSKAFAREPANFGEMPNTQVGFFSLGHPGTLPLVNRLIIEQAIMLGLVLNCQISKQARFDRKHYFYPDSPKGYQITQHFHPIAQNGKLKVGQKYYPIQHIIIEEDAAKSTHDVEHDISLIDFNRAGVPLLEIVTEPCFSEADEVVHFIKELRQLLLFLEICNGNMEDGSLRCDVNISINTDARPTNKVEIKNLNSFRRIREAIQYEVARQEQSLKNGDRIKAETRLYDPETGITSTMRYKEELADYRYMPEPDIPPINIDDKLLMEIHSRTPSLPNEIRKQLESFNVPHQLIEVLTSTPGMAKLSSRVIQGTQNQAIAAKLIAGPLMREVKQRTDFDYGDMVLANRIIELADMINTGKVSFSTASYQILPKLLNDLGKLPALIADELSLEKADGNNALRDVAMSVLIAYPEKVEKYKNGQNGLLGFFISELRKSFNGKFDPKDASELLSELLEK